MKILFNDPCSPKQYEAITPSISTLGGTEATCARLMRELSKRDQILINQRDREMEKTDDYGIQYLKPDTVIDKPDVVITLRDGKIFRVMNDRYPSVRHLLWMHDVVGGDYKGHLDETIGGFPTHFIVGSQWQLRQLVSQYQNEFASGLYKVTILTNFVESYCDRTPKSLEYDPYKLIFYSSPHKGLDHVYGLYVALKKVEPKYKLYVANPGYCINSGENPDDYVNLGIMLHKDLMEEIRTSLCTFYPNVSFPETFGLVYAESNAVGTPVLAHDLGAASEVVTTPAQIIDCANAKKVIDTIVSWTNGERPIVKVKEQYTIKEAMKVWRKFLNPMFLNE